MEGVKSSKRQSVIRAEAQSSPKKQNVTMELDTLDCPICSQPLRPPIFQCPKGDFICSPCREKLPERERPASWRCFGVERIVNSTFVPCKHGCLTKITYYDIEEHEKECAQGSFFCPVSGCGFAAPTMALLNHLTTLHKLPAQRINNFVPFELKVQPGSHVLCGGYRRLFLLNVASLESLGHAVSIVCAQPSIPSGMIGCSVGFSCFEGHYQVSLLEIGRSTLSDGLQTQNFCVVPKVSGEQADVVLSITISLLYEGNEEPNYEEDDEDSSYEEGKELDDITTKWRMAVTELEMKEEDADDSEEEEDNDSEEEEDGNMAMIDWRRWVVTITNMEKEHNKGDKSDDHNGN